MDVLSARPLGVSPDDQRLFVGYDHPLGVVERAVELDWNLLVLGPRGGGVSSFLNAATARWCHNAENDSADRTRSVAVWAGGASHPAELVEALVAALRNERARPVHHDDDAVDGAIERLREAAEASGIHQVIVDDLHDADLAWRVFGQHRDQMWAAGVRFLVGGDSARRPDYLRPPADQFFEQVIELPPLSRDEATKLLQRRLSHHDIEVPGGNRRAFARAVVDSLEARRSKDDTAAWYPGRVLAWTRDAIAHGIEPEELAKRHQPLRVEAAKKARSAGVRVFDALTALGPRSASDQELLGWTKLSRPRVSQILNELEEVGVVVGEDQRHGEGRPRRVYRLVEPEAGR